MRSIIAKVCLIGFLVLPLAFEQASLVDADHGLVWLLAHQLYYLPLSWVGPPFFLPDSDISFTVSNLGLGLVLVVYPAAGLGISCLVRRFARLPRAG